MFLTATVVAAFWPVQVLTVDLIFLMDTMYLVHSVLRASYPDLPSQLFFVAVEKTHAFFHSCEKKVVTGYEASLWLVQYNTQNYLVVYVVSVECNSVLCPDPFMSAYWRYTNRLSFL